METVGRVFAAVALPPEVQMALKDQLSEAGLPGKTVPLANLHLTLRFLDVVTDVVYDRFLAALAPMAVQGTFRVTLSRLGVFPNPRRATVLWAGVGTGALELARLNEIAEQAAQTAGLTPEERPFHPHVTLSRIRPPLNVSHLLDYDIDVSWRCSHMVLFRSHLVRGGVSYEALDSYPLVR